MSVVVGRYRNDVNPLSVATNISGKKRLILDLSVLNKFVKKQKFKFEDWKLAIQFFNNIHPKFYVFSQSTLYSFKIFTARNI
jgi:hypothetical protein